MQENPDYSVSALDEGEIFTITRSSALNSITLSVLDGLSSCLDRLERQQKRYVILSADGSRAFSAGTDLKEVISNSPQATEHRVDSARTLLFRLSRSPLISICAINGLAYGGGLELAMACTFRLAVAHATVALPEIKLGLLPSYGGTQFLPALIGKARALDLMLTGRSITATEAYQVGLVNRVVDSSDDLLLEARRLAENLMEFSPAAISAVRQCVDASGSDVTEAGLEVEGQLIRAIAGTDDAKEGIQAFVEKRTPVFIHRKMNA